MTLVRKSSTVLCIGLFFLVLIAVQPYLLPSLTPRAPADVVLFPTFPIVLCLGLFISAYAMDRRTLASRNLPEPSSRRVLLIPGVLTLLWGTVSFFGALAAYSEFSKLLSGPTDQMTRQSLGTQLLIQQQIMVTGILLISIGLLLLSYSRISE